MNDPSQTGEKTCPFCAETIKAAAVKCRFCGEFLDRPSHAAQAAAPPRDRAVPADGACLYQGHVSRIVLLLPAVNLLVCGLVAGLLFVFDDALFARFGYDFEHRALLTTLLSSCLLLLALACFFVKWLVYKSKIFRITTDRIEIEQGILNKSIHNMDMWRVKDIGFTQGFFQKLFGLGMVHLWSSDASAPRLEIGPLANARAMYDVLKKAQLAADRRRGVLHVEQ